MLVISNSAQRLDDSTILLDFQSNYESSLSLDTLGFLQHSSRANLALARLRSDIKPKSERKAKEPVAVAQKERLSPKRTIKAKNPPNYSARATEAYFVT